MWQQLADLGLLGLSFSSEHGGFDGGPVEQMIVMEAFGAGLVIEPYLSTVILGGNALKLSANGSSKSELLKKKSRLVTI